MNTETDAIIANALRAEADRLIMILTASGVAQEKAEALVTEMFASAASRVFDNPAFAGIAAADKEQIIQVARAAYDNNAQASGC